MLASLVTGLFDLLARLPLAALHRLGAALGWATYLLSGKYAERLRENLGHVWDGRPEEEFRPVLRENVAQMGMAMVELPWLWRRPLSEVTTAVRTCEGWEYVETAQAAGKGLIFLTPHLGCFEISALYIAERIPLTVMYRVPKLAWLEPVMRAGRGRGMVTLARADASGVRTMFKTLKRGGAIGLLPDQAPGNGEGEWAEFFGRPAYTMTLAGRLAESTGATVLMVYTERLPHGQGYVLRFTPLPVQPDVPFARTMNAALEQAIMTCPTQYLWAYNRYKVPAGAEPPPAPAADKEA